MQIIRDWISGVSFADRQKHQIIHHYQSHSSKATTGMARNFYGAADKIITR
jgi:hypothetical protein